MFAAETSQQVDGNSRILYAEDNFSIRCFVTEMLAFEGFDVTAVETGDDGVVVFETMRFDLLLTDVRMPGAKDGLDLATYARQKDPGLPVVIVSGFADELSARLQKLSGRTIFLKKPFRIDELLTVIRAYLPVA